MECINKKHNKKDALLKVSITNPKGQQITRIARSEVQLSINVASTRAVALFWIQKVNGGYDDKQCTRKPKSQAHGKCSIIFQPAFHGNMVEELQVSLQSLLSPPTLST